MKTLDPVNVLGMVTDRSRGVVWQMDHHGLTIKPGDEVLCGFGLGLCGLVVQIFILISLADKHKPWLYIILSGC